MKCQAGWSTAGIKIARRNINNLRYTDDTTLMAEREEEQKSLLIKVKEESGKVGLKLNIQETKIVAYGPITSWQIEGETVETVRDFFLRLQNYCRWWLQSWNWKMLDQPRQHLKKQRHYFTNNGLSSQSYGFSSSHVWMWELDYKEVEHRRLMLLNCDVGEETWDSLGLQGDPSSPS